MPAKVRFAGRAPIGCIDSPSDQKARSRNRPWIPAYAGMTGGEGSSHGYHTLTPARTFAILWAATSKSECPWQVSYHINSSTARARRGGPLLMAASPRLSSCRSTSQGEVKEYVPADGLPPPRAISPCAVTRNANLGQNPRRDRVPGLIPRPCNSLTSVRTGVVTG